MKMFGKIYLYSLLGVFLVSNAWALDVDKVRLAAENWLQTSEVYQASERNYAIEKIDPINIIGDFGEDFFRVSLKPSGYIVVSSDERIFPVICFSLKGNLDLTPSSDNALRAMLESDLQANQEVLQVLDGGGFRVLEQSAIDSVSRNRNEWEGLLGNDTLSQPQPSSDYTPTNVLVEPFLQTSWSQWNHYNDLCPIDPDPSSGYDRRCPVGCVAVVAAQLMYYYQWPAYGQGSHAYIDNAGTVTGEHSRVFADEYDWGSMRTNYSAYSTYPTNETAAIAELMYELGVAVEMDYDTNGSASAMSDLRWVANEHFSYTPGEKLARSDDEDHFDQRIREDLLEYRPVPLSVPGHAILVDGLSSDSNTNYFHMNYGWGGQNDGWYRPSNLNEGSLQEGVFGLDPQMKPLLDAPGSSTNLTGDFTCRWSIPDSVSNTVQYFRAREGTFISSNMTDRADSFSSWEPAFWQLDNPGYGGSGNCFKIVSEFYLTSSLRYIHPIRVEASCQISFNYFPRLVADTFAVDVSTDAGKHWEEIFSTNNVDKWTWLDQDLDLSAYAGERINLRFRYQHDGGSIYPDASAVKLDNIEISGGRILKWSTLDSGIPPTRESYSLSEQSDGDRYYTVEAYDGGSWSKYFKPLRRITVDASGDHDVDGMPNGWEYEYFNTPTGAVYTADMDGDKMSNGDEYIAGTIPIDPESLFEIPSVQTGAGRFEMEWMSVSNRVYSVWRAGEPGQSNFSCIASNLTATPPSNHYSDSDISGLDSGYYRVEAMIEE